MAATERTRYDTVAMWLHWLTAFLIIFMLVFGEDLMNRWHPDPFNASVHASIGATILMLSLIRLMWRMRRPSPPLPETMRLWEIALSKVTHIIFYIMMMGLPISGWLAFSDTVEKHPGFAGTSFFGLLPVVEVPAAVGLPFDGIHSLGSNFMIALISLHVLAALKHQFIDKDHLLRRMVPLKLRDNP
jgi:cytochrome b561